MASENGNEQFLSFPLEYLSEVKEISTHQAKLIVWDMSSPVVVVVHGSGHSLFHVALLLLQKFNSIFTLTSFLNARHLQGSLNSLWIKHLARPLSWNEEGCWKFCSPYASHSAKPAWKLILTFGLACRLLCGLGDAIGGSSLGCWV